MPDPTFKLAPSLRAQIANGALARAAVMVQSLGKPGEDTVLRALGLEEADGMWRGDLTADQIVRLASLAVVGYIYAADVIDGPTPPREKPPTPVRRATKRGHTKLPPRRP